MGSECSASLSAPPTIRTEVLGVKAIARLELIRNGRVIASAEPAARRVRFSHVDRDAAAGTSYYHIRVTQEDGMFAWGSPVWVTYR